MEGLATPYRYQVGSHTTNVFQC